MIFPKIIKKQHFTFDFFRKSVYLSDFPNLDYCIIWVIYDSKNKKNDKSKKYDNIPKRIQA